MHIIDVCPRCGQDFMRHTSEHHLYRPVAYDPITGEPVSWDVICQECDEKERMQNEESNTNESSDMGEPVVG